MFHKSVFFGIIWCTIMGALCVPAQAQETPAERFRYMPAPTTDDTTEILGLIRQGASIRWNQPDSAMQLFVQAKEKSMACGFTDGVAKSLLNIGVTHIAHGNYEQSFRAYDEAEFYCRHALYFGDDLVWSRYNEMASTYLYMGIYDRAAYFFHQALQAARDTVAKAFIYSNLSTVHIRIGDFPAAFFYLNEGIRLAMQTHAYANLSSLLSNMGNWYAARKLPHVALAYYMDGLMLATRSRDTFMIQRFHQGMGEVLLNQGDARRAIPFFQSVLNAGKGSRYYTVINPLYSLGAAYSALGRYTEAERMLQEGISAAQQTGILENILSAYNTLIDVYDRSGQYEAAFNTMRLLTALRDSVMTSEEKTAIKQLEVKYQISEKDKELAQNNILILRQKNQLFQKNILIGIITFSTVTLGILSVMLWALYRNNQHKQKLQNEYLRNREQKEEINVMSALIDGAERERARLAQELHDGIGGMLAAAQLCASAVQRRNPLVATEMTPFIKMLDETSNEVRKAAHNLMPDNLVKHGFEQAVHSYCDQIKSSGQLAIDLHIRGPVEGLSSKVELSLYRIVQQLLQNIIRHAEASKASVQIHKVQEKVGIMIEDNGRGFHLEAQNPGIGLDNIRSRVKALQGMFSLDSAPGQGTNVYIEIDLQKLNTQLN